MLLKPCRVPARLVTLLLVSERQSFSLDVPGGQLGGWLAGVGTPVLLLHGGPGLGYEYLDELGAEIGVGFEIAAFQQRGLPPSTIEGPFTIRQAISDIVSVLDSLGWARALITGHSWGGHLALRFAAMHPERALGMLAIEPIGVLGDGGKAAFGAELLARTPRAGRDRIREIDELETAGKGTAEEALESLELLWPAYFADPESAPPMPATRISLEAYSALSDEMMCGNEQVAARLANCEAACGILAGAGSPIPWGQAAQASVELMPRAFLSIVAGAGHFPWLDVPGCVRDALQRLGP